MKIITGSQQPTLAQQTADTRAVRAESGAAGQKPAAKQLPNADNVEFSAALASELKNQQAEQLKRLESIKSLVSSGKYRVSSRDVAEKMLSGSSDD